VLQSGRLHAGVSVTVNQSPEFRETSVLQSGRLESVVSVAINQSLAFHETSIFQSILLSGSHRQLSGVLSSAVIRESDSSRLSVPWIFSDSIPNSAGFDRSSFFSVGALLKQSETLCSRRANP
jgi:hypothetical protein